MRRCSVSNNLFFMKLLIPCLCWFALGALCRGEVFTVGFEDSFGACPAEFVEKGMRFTTDNPVMCFKDGTGINSVSNGTRTTENVNGLLFRQVEGRPFTPISVDLAEYSVSVGAYGPITFFGEKAAGGTVEFTVTLDNVRDGPGGVADYQTVMFPANFSDVVSVRTVDKNFSLDHVVISGHVPPALPPAPLPASSFKEGVSLWTTNQSNYVLRGEDFFFRVGSLAPTQAVYLAPPSPTVFNPGSYGSYDPATSTMAFKATNTIETYAGGGGESTTVVTAQQMVDAGFPNYSFHRTAITGGRLVFMAYTVQDKFGLFQMESGVITPRLTMDTDLPVGTGTGKPFAWPRHLAAKGNDFAFDTTVGGIRRVYASFNNGPFQLIASTGDELAPSQVISDFTNLSFNGAGQLEVNCQTGGSLLWRLTHNAAGPVAGELLTRTISPVNAGEEVTGEIVSASGEPLFLQTETAIYQESAGKWYRVIGRGDKIQLATIWEAKFMAARKQTPGHIVVQTISDIDNLTRTYDIEVLPPVEHPPKLGTSLVHHESGDLYVPLSYLTHGRSYKVMKSTDLVTWVDFSEIGEVLPIQHVVIRKADLGNPSFFRVVEKAVVLPPP